eukprot:scaffold19917_cov122-Isochrysis_galbana.AAC.2
MGGGAAHRRPPLGYIAQGMAVAGHGRYLQGDHSQAWDGTVVVYIARLRGRRRWCGGAGKQVARREKERSGGRRRVCGAPSWAAGGWGGSRARGMDHTQPWPWSWGGGNGAAALAVRWESNLNRAHAQEGAGLLCASIARQVAEAGRAGEGFRPGHQTEATSTVPICGSHAEVEAGARTPEREADRGRVEGERVQGERPLTG